MSAAFVTSLALQLGAGLDSDKPVDFAWIMIITVSVTTIVWLTVTFLTEPESDQTLLKFYLRARPGISGWGPIARLAPDIPDTSDGWRRMLDWFAGCALIYGVLFGVGKLLLGEWTTGLVLLGLGFAAGAVIWWDLSRRGWGSVAE
jgi:hypothetical protein